MPSQSTIWDPLNKSGTLWRPGHAPTTNPDPPDPPDPPVDTVTYKVIPSYYNEDVYFSFQEGFTATGVKVDWGDGGELETWEDGEVPNHEYNDAPGNYIITVTADTLTALCVPNREDITELPQACRLKQIVQLTKNDITDGRGLFAGHEYLEEIHACDLSSVIQADDMFLECWRLTWIEALNLAKVTNLGGPLITTVENVNLQWVDYIDLSSLEDATALFKDFYYFEELTSMVAPALQVTDEMFFGTANLSILPDYIDMSNVTSAEQMFAYCGYRDLDLSYMCVPHLAERPYRFDYNTTGLVSPVWGTCPVPPPSGD